MDQLIKLKSIIYCKLKNNMNDSSKNNINEKVLMKIDCKNENDNIYGR